MRIRSARHAPLLVALLALPLPAAAEDWVREGWYAGGRGVYTQVDFDTSGVANDDFGFNLFAGYRIYEYLASDFEFEYIDAIEVRGKPGPNFDVRTFNLSWLFRLYPLGFVLEPSSPFQRVQPYLVAGPALQWVQLQRKPGNDGDQGNFAGRLGAGFEVYLTESLAFNADAKYMLGTGDVKDYRYWSIGWGFAWRFGAEDSSWGGSEDDDEAAPAKDEPAGDDAAEGDASGDEAPDADE